MLECADDLTEMLADNASARSPFRASELVWTGIAEAFQRYAVDNGINRVEAQVFNSRFASYGRSDRHYEHFAANLGNEHKTNDFYRRACELFYARLKARDAHGILERSAPSAVSEFARVVVPVGDGKRASWDYLLTVEELQTIASQDARVLTEAVALADLGCGWGRLGYLLVSLNPRATYAAFDIPETLIVAQEYLPTHLPDAHVHKHIDNRKLAVIDREALQPGLWFFGTQDLDRVADGTFDVFANVFSFQEMTLQQVTEYLEIAGRVVVLGGLFYTQQRCAGDVMTRDSYSYPPSWQKLCDRLSVFSPLYFEAAFRV